jgi:hypothetical protein
MSPFEFLNSINDTKVNLMVDDVTEKAYNSFMVNRGLSYFPDTVLLANEMNRLHHAAKPMQYAFLINTVRKKKRFSKWLKPQEHEDLLIVKEYYGYSNEKARSALSVLSAKQLQDIRKKLDKGGKSTTRSQSTT